MKTYQITLVYTAYTHYVIEAESEEAAEAQAWQRVDGECTQYGEWKTSEIAELNYANS